MSRKRRVVVLEIKLGGFKISVQKKKKKKNHYKNFEMSEGQMTLSVV
jgi:hypothetical protein